MEEGAPFLETLIAEEIALSALRVRFLISSEEKLAKCSSRIFANFLADASEEAVLDVLFLMAMELY